MAAGVKKTSETTKAPAKATAVRKTAATAGKKKSEAGPRLRVLNDGEFMTKAGMKRISQRAGVQRLHGGSVQFANELAAEYLRLLTEKAAVCTDVGKRSTVNEADITAAGKALGLYLHGTENKKKKKKKADKKAEGEAAAPEATSEMTEAAHEEEAPAQDEEAAEQQQEEEQQQQEEASE